jgi:hypothetical protein
MKLRESLASHNIAQLSADSLQQHAKKTSHS